jgi:hypothetical protein
VKSEGALSSSLLSVESWSLGIEEEEVRKAGTLLGVVLVGVLLGFAVKTERSS